MLALSKPRSRKTLRAPSIICRCLAESASPTRRREDGVSATIGLAFEQISRLGDNSEGYPPYIIGIEYTLTEPFGQCYLRGGRVLPGLCLHHFFDSIWRGPSWPQRETRPRGFCATSRTRLVTRWHTRLPLRWPIPLARMFPTRPPAVPKRYQIGRRRGILGWPSRWRRRRAQRRPPKAATAKKWSCSAQQH